MASLYGPKAKRRKIECTERTLMTVEEIRSAQDVRHLLRFRQSSAPEVKLGTLYSHLLCRQFVIDKVQVYKHLRISSQTSMRLAASLSELRNRASSRSIVMASLRMRRTVFNVETSFQHGRTPPKQTAIPF